MMTITVTDVGYTITYHYNYEGAPEDKVERLPEGSELVPGDPRARGVLLLYVVHRRGLQGGVRLYAAPLRRCRPLCLLEEGRRHLCRLHGKTTTITAPRIAKYLLPCRAGGDRNTARRSRAVRLPLRRLVLLMRAVLRPSILAGYHCGDDGLCKVDQDCSPARMNIRLRRRIPTLCGKSGPSWSGQCHGPRHDL